MSGEWNGRGHAGSDVYCRMPRRIPWSTIILGVLFIFAGTMHFVVPAPYEKIVPRWLPNARLIVQISGVAEILGGLGVLVPGVLVPGGLALGGLVPGGLVLGAQRAAGIGLIILLVAVFPANVEMLRLARAGGAPVMAEAALWLRLPLQPVLIWWVWRASLR